MGCSVSVFASLDAEGTVAELAEAVGFDATAVIVTEKKRKKTFPNVSTHEWKNSYHPA